MDSNFVSRLKEAMRSKDMRQVDVARASGIDRSVISCYLSGRYRPNGKNAVILANALGVSEAWLMGFDVPTSTESEALAEMVRTGILPAPPISRGDVPPEAFLVGQEPPIEDDFLANLSDEAFELLEIFQSLSRKGKTLLMARAYELEKDGESDEQL